MYRDGTAELFKDLNKANVPILVFSAGLGDLVVAVLKHCDVLFSNVKVNLFLRKGILFSIVYVFNFRLYQIF